MPPPLSQSDEDFIKASSAAYAARMAASPVQAPTPQESTAPEAGGSGFLSSAADLFRKIVPQGLRDAGGAAVHQANSITDLIDALDPRNPNYGGTDATTPNAIDQWSAQHIGKIDVAPVAKEDLAGARLKEITKNLLGETPANILDTVLSPSIFLPVAKAGLAVHALPAVAGAAAARTDVGAVLLREAAVQGASTAAGILAAKGLDKVDIDGAPIPDAAKFAIKLAAPIAAAALTGKVTESAVGAAFPALAHTSAPVQQAVKATLPAGTPWTRPTLPDQFVAPTMSFAAHEALIGNRPGAADLDAVAGLSNLLAIDKTNAADGRLAKPFYAYTQMVSANQNASKNAVAAALDSKGNVFNLKEGSPAGKLANGKIVPFIGDMLENPNAPKVYGLNQTETDYWMDYRMLIWQASKYGADHGIPEAQSWAKDFNSIKAPRQVISLITDSTDIDSLRKNTPFRARLYADMAEGAKNGLNYDNPVVAARQYVQTMYDTVAMKEFDEFMKSEPVGNLDTRMVSASDIAGSLTARKSNIPLAKIHTDAQDLVRSLRGKVDTASHRVASLQGALSTGQKAIDSGLHVIGEGPTTAVEVLNNYGWRPVDPLNNNRVLDKVAADLQAANQVKSNLGTALSKAVRKNDLVQGVWNRAMARSLNAEWAPGHLFGYTSVDQVPVGKWRNNFVLKTVKQPELKDAVGKVIQEAKVVEKTGYDELARWVDTQTGKVNGAGWAASTANDLMNLYREAGATGDLAAPFIQGLLTLGYAPVTWAKASLLHYKALLMPTTQAKYIADNTQAISEMGQYGVKAGNAEMFAASGERGGALAQGVRKYGSKIPVIGGAYAFAARRFQQSYETFNTVIRSELWKGLEGTMVPEERARFINWMTGGVDPRRLGISPTATDVEGAWLAFSPQLTRSTIALVANAATARGQAGQEALTALSRMASVGAGMFVASAYAKGMSDKEIQDGLNPTSGRKFLSLNINGNWVGPGGLVRSIAQLVAKVATNPGSLAAGFTGDDGEQNPLLNFYVGRSSPGIAFLGAGLEASTSGKVDSYPFEALNGPGDFLTKFVGPSLMPFGVQGLLQQGATRTDDRLIGGPVPIDKAGLSAFPAQFLGARTSPLTAKDFKDQKAAELTDGKVTDFSKLTGQQQQGIEAQNAETLANYASQGSKQSQDYAAAKKRAIDTTHNTEQTLVRTLESGGTTLAGFRGAVADAQRDRVTSEKAAQEALGVKFPDNTDDVVNQYFKMHDAIQATTGVYDPEAVDAADAEFLSTLTPEQQDLIDGRRTFKHDPSIQWYFDAKQAITDSGYWDAQQSAFKPYANMVRALTGAGSYAEFEAAIEQATPAKKAALSVVKNKIDAVIATKRTRLRTGSPELERALAAVYGTVPIRQQKK